MVKSQERLQGSLGGEREDGSLPEVRPSRGPARAVLQEASRYYLHPHLAAVPSLSLLHVRELQGYIFTAPRSIQKLMKSIQEFILVRLVGHVPHESISCSGLFSSNFIGT